jgi:TonB family protein
MWGAPIAVAQDLPRAIISRIGPAYPEAARLMHIEADVNVRIHVRPNGSVATAKAERGYDLLAEEAEKCALKWRFMPGPHADEFVVTVTFKL